MLILTETEKDPMMSSESPDLPKTTARHTVEPHDILMLGPGKTIPDMKQSLALPPLMSQSYSPPSVSPTQQQQPRRHDRDGQLHQQQQAQQEQQQQQQRQAHHNWDINDSTIPIPDVCDTFDVWPTGHCRRVYRSDCDDARRHVSGWAMRNTNNHNALILKKSCLGVLVCSLDCVLDNGKKVNLRPAICDKARRKQIGKSCPNPNCCGRLDLLPCRGHCGYPVTHFWRHVNDSVFFQAKGYHDHARPDIKSLSEKGRNALAKHFRHSLNPLVLLPSKRRSTMSCENAPLKKMAKAGRGNEVMCSCSPFECNCGKSFQDAKPDMIPGLEYYKSPQHATEANPCGPTGHTSMYQSGFAPEQHPPGPFTQINITNTCLQPPAVDSINPIMDSSKTVVNVPLQNPYVCYHGGLMHGKEDPSRFMKYGAVDDPNIGGTVLTSYNPSSYQYDDTRLRHLDHSYPPVSLRPNDVRLMSHPQNYWNNSDPYSTPSQDAHLRSAPSRFEEPPAFDCHRKSPESRHFPPNIIYPMKPNDSFFTSENVKAESSESTFVNQTAFSHHEVQQQQHNLAENRQSDNMAMSNQNFLFDLNAMNYNNETPGGDLIQQSAMEGEIEQRLEYDCDPKRDDSQAKEEQQSLTFTTLTPPSKCGYGPKTCQHQEGTPLAPSVPVDSMTYQMQQQSTNVSYAELTRVHSVTSHSMMSCPMDRDTGLTCMNHGAQNGGSLHVQGLPMGCSEASSPCASGLRNDLPVSSPIPNSSPHHDVILPNADQHTTGYNQGISYHNSPNLNYGYYYGDYFQGSAASQHQRQRQNSINITLTYN